MSNGLIPECTILPLLSSLFLLHSHFSISLLLTHRSALITLLLAYLSTTLGVATQSSPSTENPTTAEYAPGQLSNASVASGVSFNFTGVASPEPIRGDHGTKNLIQENDELNKQNPDSWAPPVTDSGSVASHFAALALRRPHC